MLRFDWLLAHRQISRLTVVSFSISLFASPLGAVIFLLSLVGGRRSAIVALILLIVWAMPVGVDQPRG